MKKINEVDLKAMFDSYKFDGNYLSIKVGEVKPTNLSDKGIKFEYVKGDVDIMVLDLPDEIIELIKLAKKVITEKATSTIIPVNQNILLKAVSEQANVLILDNPKSLASIGFKHITVEALSFDTRFKNKNIKIKSDTVREDNENITYDNVILGEGVADADVSSNKLIGREVIVSNMVLGNDSNTVHTEYNPYSILNVIGFMKANPITAYHIRVFQTLVPNFITTEFFLVPEHDLKAILN
jgi:hypothetical protein